MNMLKAAKNKMAYAKVGLYGRAGCGKTFTAAKIAIGLWQYAKLTKPVGMFDTEPAASFIIPLFEEAKIPFVVYDESRALSDLMRFMDEAEKECSIVIIDSITHVWRDAQKSYIDKVNATRRGQNKSPIYQLEFHHWRPIKEQWARFTDRFLSAKCHIILCGRAGGVYEYQKNESTGKQELITTGDRMATEKELGYEPSLLVEMVSERVDGKIVIRALVEKDRSNQINGSEIEYPTFKDFLPHFKSLNVGGEHFGSMEKRDSQDLYDGNDAGATNWDKEKRQREIYCEEIKSLFIEFGLSGTSTEARAKQNQALKDIFGTGSWTKVEETDSKTLAEKCEKLKVYLNDKAA